jgi:uncharacterized protein (TIGR03083 family)
VDYLEHLRQESHRFREAVLDAPAGGQVPTCPDWDAEDLLWHLAEVQWFWGQVVGRSITAPPEAEALTAARPSDRASLVVFFDAASSELSAVLDEREPETPAWTWAPEQTVGFIRRRQAHEALIHRLDAELTLGARTPMDTSLSADGIDEVLRIMYGGLPPWGTFTPDVDRTLRIETTDTTDSWLVTLGTFRGTDPTDDASYDEPDISVAEVDIGAPALATISGRASDLDCWLWHRPTEDSIERSGDTAVHASFDAVIGPGIN